MGDEDDNNNNDDDDNNQNNGQHQWHSQHIFWTCCNDNQTLFLLLYITFQIIGYITMGTIVMKPIRLLCTFLHEGCHAIVCYVTRGEVLRINVYDNASGITQYRGGIRCCIIPAGYIGCSICGTICILCSSGPISSTILSILLLCSLLVSLCYLPNKTMIYLNVSYSILILVALYLEWFLPRLPPMLQFIVLYFGVIISFYSLCDIYYDTILHVVDGSDATACTNEIIGYKYCSSRFVGIQWFVLVLLFQCIGFYYTIVQQCNECIEINGYQCFKLITTNNNNNNESNESDQNENTNIFGTLWETIIDLCNGPYFFENFHFDGFFEN